MPPDCKENAPAATPHRMYEDIYALLVGNVLLTLGLMLLGKAGLVGGGVVGIALILSYLSNLPVGLFLVGLTLPALSLALRTMGTAFALKTLLATLCLGAMTWFAPRLLTIAYVDRATAAIAGGTVVGMGALALARHGAATGGSGIIVLWLYRSRGWNAGRTQIWIDGTVLMGSLVALSPDRVAWSLIGLMATAAILLVWHRPGRYTGY